MKKFLSLILVAAMLVAVLAMVGCNKPDETTEGTTTAAPTTTATTAAPTTTATTAAPTTTATTAAPTTTATTTVAPTTTETTTVAPTTTETTTVAPVTESTLGTMGETLPIFARFDFGTKTKAEAEGWTSHAYLTSALTYNASYIQIEYTEDTIVIYATKNFDKGMDRTNFALCFEDIVSYDFDDEFIQGYGTWDGAPVSNSNVGNDEKWKGLHQFMKVRIKNDTANNMIAMHWHRSGEGYSTRTLNSCMYLQGGAPTDVKDHKLTATPTKEWKTYTYDMVFLAGLGREVTTSDAPKSYVDAVKGVKARNSNYQHNWNTANGNITGVQFHFLGALGQGQEFFTDSRANIKMGNKVEVDYVVFGSTLDQVNGYTSYLEDKAA